MPRKRELQKYVTVFTDRYGKERFRFRRGKVSIYLPPPGSAEYRAAYDKALNGTDIAGRTRDKSVGDLVSRFYRTMSFKRGGDGWQRTMRQSIEPFREEFADDLVSSFRPKDVDVVLDRRFEKRVVNGKKVGGSASAERLREMLMRLFTLPVCFIFSASLPIRTILPSLSTAA